jgi:hypothetical protein
VTDSQGVRPLADTASKLGVTLTHPLIDVVDDYARALPIVAAHVVQADPTVVYWVSGSSLVRIESGASKQLDGGRTATHAVGAVRSLANVVHADVEADAVSEPGGAIWTVYRTVKVQFEDTTLEFPDPLSLPLDNNDKRRQVRLFLDALLKAIDAR